MNDSLRVYYCVTMISRMGDKLYLKLKKHQDTSNKVQCEWSKTPRGILTWETEKQAKEFGKTYFTHFKDYKIEQIGYDYDLKFYNLEEEEK